MVDFNNDSTISTPAVDIVRVLILERYNNALESIEFHRKKILAGVADPTDVIASRIYSLFLLNEKPLSRRLGKAGFENLENLVNSTRESDLISAFRIINDVLDQLRLTRIDTGKEIDTTNIEAENRVKGL